MELEIKENPKYFLITPQEKSIENFNSREFKGKITDLINENNKSVILNLSKIDFIDSSGLGSLVSILKLLTSRQNNIVICEAKDAINRIFNLTRHNQVIPLLADEEAAIKFLENHTQPLLSKKEEYSSNL